MQKLLGQRAGQDDRPPPPAAAVRQTRSGGRDKACSAGCDRSRSTERDRSASRDRTVTEETGSAERDGRADESVDVAEATRRQLRRMGVELSRLGANSQHG